MTSWKLDFGEGAPVEGYVGVDASTQFSPERGFGWVSDSQLQVRDRGAGDRLLGRFVQGTSSATFCLAVDPGRYLVQIVMGDRDYGNHVLQVAIRENNEEFPELSAEAGEYVILTVLVGAPAGSLELEFSSPGDNWVVNSVTVEPAEDGRAVEANVIRRKFSDPLDGSFSTGHVPPAPIDSLPGATFDACGLDGGLELTQAGAGVSPTDKSEHCVTPYTEDQGDHEQALRDDRGVKAVAEANIPVKPISPGSLTGGTPSSAEDGSDLFTRARRVFGSWLGARSG